MKAEKINQTGTRIAYWDNIKGLLIALVVFAHCLYGYQDRHYIGFLVLAIYYVHMPAFVFISGYFSRNESSRKKETLLKFILSYILVISIYIAVDVVRGRTPHILSTYRSEWYLIALVIWRLLSPYLGKHKWVIPALVGLGLVAGYWPDLGGNETLSINKVVTFFPFFAAGLLMNGDHIQKLRKASPKYKMGGWRCFAL